MNYKVNLTKASMILLVLISCSPIGTAATQSTETNIVSNYPSTSLPSQFPTATVDSIASITPFPNYSVKQACLETLSDLPLPINGQIILYEADSSNPPYLFDFTTNTKKMLTENAMLFRVSPHGNRLAYLISGKLNTTESLAIIDLFGNQPDMIIKWQEGWAYLQGWLDDDHLLINVKANKQYPPYDLAVLNISTEQTNEISSNYPEMHIDYSVWNLSRAVYNTSLTSLIYQSYQGSNVLWNLKTNKEILHILSSPSNPEPKWLSDDQTALVVGVPRKELEEAGDELFLVNTDGKVSQLTYLTELYPFVDIGGFSISPDEQIVGFWFIFESSENIQQPNIVRPYQLAILNLESGEVINYCIQSNTQGPPLPPIWSPDGKFLLVQDTNYEHNKIFIINVQERWIYNFSTDLWAAIWVNGELR